MKKISILGLCALMGLGAMAQESVLKEAEKATKGGAPFDEVVTIITPAFSDATTSKDAQTFYIPGKYAFKLFDGLIGEETIKGQLTEEQEANKAKYLLAGYDFYMKALPLDTVVEVDKKGKEKIKTKYSKEIVDQVAGHYSDLNNVGIYSYNNQDYKGAHTAWSLYSSLPSNPAYGKKIQAVPDSIMSQIVYYQGLASFMLEDYKSAAKEIEKSIDLGNDTKEAYDYAIYCANLAEDNDNMINLSMKAYKKFGQEESSYMAQIINFYLNEKEYNKALDIINMAIADAPQNSQYHLIKGVLFENSDNLGDPLAEYTTAFELDPNNATAYAYAGRIIVDRASVDYDAVPESEFDKAYATDLKPRLLKGVELLEKAYSLDNDNLEPMRKAYEAYYLLNDATNMNRVGAILGIQ